MPPKQKKTPKRSKKRNKNESESSVGSDFSEGRAAVVETDRVVAMSLAEPRKTRASARACSMKMQDVTMMDRAMRSAENKSNLHSSVKFDFTVLTTSPNYDHPELVRKMTPAEFTMDYYNTTGLNEVLIFECDPHELGMKMVDENFTPRDVERLVGGDRMISCVRVQTQGSEEMPLRDFVDLFYTPKEDRKVLYNVLSLEFSNTGLADLVRSPSLVREIDWAAAWPDERKHRTVTFDKSKGDNRFTFELHYPRVENYCLMSPTASYTDFHIDFHGTSVWYHVKKGKKIFWIVEPTEQNIKMYEEYLKHTEQSAFFGDVPDKCHRVVVNPGNTLIIPSGWIHAVFTPEDSLVFGGNFLHSRGISMQIAVLQSENRIGINKRYRYPQSEEAMFHMMSELVKSCTGREYVRPLSKNQQNLYKEYVGELFLKAGGHRRIPKEEDYLDDGKVWDENWDESEAFIESRKKLEPHEKKNEEENGDEKIEDAALDSNGLAKEANVDGRGEGTATNHKEEQWEAPKEPTTMEEFDRMIEEEERRKMEEKKEREREESKPAFGGHDDFFIDSNTFYHPESFNCDAGPGVSSLHLIPPSNAEPPLNIDREALKSVISPWAIPELERLVQYTRKKTKIEVPYGLTRPNSLITALTVLLRVRRQMAEGEGIILPTSILPDQKDYYTEQRQMIQEEQERRKRIANRKAAKNNDEDDADYDPFENGGKPRTKKRRSEGGGKGAGSVGDTVPPMTLKTTTFSDLPTGSVTAIPTAKNAVKSAATKSPRTPTWDEEKKKLNQRWNKGFYAWYRTDVARQHRKKYAHLPNKQIREAVRKAHWKDLTKEQKAYWMELGQKQLKDGFEPSISGSQLSSPADKLTDTDDAAAAASTSAATAAGLSTSAATSSTAVATTASRPSTSAATPKSAVAAVAARPSTSAARPSTSAAKRATVPTPARTQVVKKEKKQRLRVSPMVAPQIVLPPSSSALSTAMTAQQLKMLKERQEQAEVIANMKRENAVKPMQGIGRPDNDVFAALALKFKSEGRFTEAAAKKEVDPSRITDDASNFITDYLTRKENVDLLLYLLPSSSPSHADDSMKRILDAKTNTMLDVVSDRFGQKIEYFHLREHIKYLMTRVAAGAHVSESTRRVPFFNSMFRLAKHLGYNTLSNRQAPAAVAANSQPAVVVAAASTVALNPAPLAFSMSSLISVKPVEEVIQLTPDEMKAGPSETALNAVPQQQVHPIQEAPKPAEAVEAVVQQQAQPQNAVSDEEDMEIDVVSMDDEDTVAVKSDQGVKKEEENGEQEKAVKKEEMETEEEKEKNENGMKREEVKEEEPAVDIVAQSDFREVICQPKPPESGTPTPPPPTIAVTTIPQKMVSPPRQISPEPALSIFTFAIQNGPCKEMRAEVILTPRKREKEKEEKSEEEDGKEGMEMNREENHSLHSLQLQQGSSNGDNPSDETVTPKRKRGRLRKEEKKDDEEEEERKEKEDEEEVKEELMSGGEESTASESVLSAPSTIKKRTRDDVWDRLKQTQMDVHVRRHTDDSTDWTAFDVFLSRKYKKLCDISNRSPSKEFALAIKRNTWSIYDEDAKNRYEKMARERRESGEPRKYWGSETVVEQEDRLVVDDKGRHVLPLGGQYSGGKTRTESESSSQPSLLIKQEDEYMEDEPVRRESNDEEMIDVEGMEEEEVPSAAAADASVVGATASSSTTSIASTTGAGETVEVTEGAEEKKVKGKPGRPKKEPTSDKKKKAVKGEPREDFMHNPSATPRGKGKKAKPDPTKPLIIDGVPVNPLAEPAVANAYGYDPAKDIVPLGQGQLKSAYRRGKAQLDTPQIDAKRYKLEVKHDHLLDDDDHDDTHRGDEMEGTEESSSHPKGREMMEGMNVHVGDHPPDGPPISPAISASQQQQQVSPFQQPQQLQPRSASFTRRPPVMPAKPAPPPLIPHAPSPLARKVAANPTDGGWTMKSGGGGGGRRRSDGGEWNNRGERTPGGRSPTRKSSQFSPAEMPPTTPTTPSTPAAVAASPAGPNGGANAAAAAAARMTRLSQAEQFSMAAPKVIEAPLRLATPITPTSSSSSLSSSVGPSKNGNEPLSASAFGAQLERITADIERANAILASNSTNNGN